LNKNIIRNFSYLSILQVGNYVIPLITIPYLIKTIGVEKYGLVMVAQSSMIYLSNLVDYGFGLTGVREISIFRNSPQKLSLVFTEILMTKSFLLIVGIIFTVILILVYPKFSDQSLLLISSFLIVIGNSFIPIYFFQGLEKMQLITALNLFSKIFFTLLIFVFIKSKNEYILVNLLQGIGALISGIIGIIIAIKFYSIKIISNKIIRRVKYRLVKNWNISLSSISISFYMNSNGLVLGYFANEEITGLYMISEKLIFLIRQLLTIFSQAVFAHICVIQDDLKEVFKFSKTVYLPFLIFVFFLFLLMFLLSDIVSQLLIQNSNTELRTYIKLFSIVPLIVCLNIPFNLLLLARNMKKTYSMILVSSVFFYLIIVLIFTKYFNVYGTIISTILTEAFVTVSMILVVYKINHSKWNFTI